MQHLQWLAGLGFVGSVAGSSIFSPDFSTPAGGIAMLSIGWPSFGWLFSSILSCLLDRYEMFTDVCMRNWRTYCWEKYRTACFKLSIGCLQRHEKRMLRGN